MGGRMMKIIDKKIIDEEIIDEGIIDEKIVDEEKLNNMWIKIIEYEKGDGLTDSNKKAGSKIVRIIDEVYEE